MPHFIFLLYFAATLFIIGAIWIVRVVHHPQFARIGEKGFTEYTSAYNLFIT